MKRLNKILLFSALLAGYFLFPCTCDKDYFSHINNSQNVNRNYVLERNVDYYVDSKDITARFK